MKTLKIVHLEDSRNDSDLLAGMLEQIYSVEMLNVDTEGAFENALATENLDLIISDFSLPSYNGATALKLARAKCPHVPFIFFSGTLGEEAAIDALHSGATDYILKHRPQRLMSAIERALRERQERVSRMEAETALRRSQERFQALIENALDVISVIAPDGRFTYNSPSMERVLGYRPEELLSTSAFNLVHPDDLAQAHSAFSQALASPNERISAEVRVQHKSGTWRNLELVGKSLLPGCAVTGVVVNSRDVTEKRETESQLLRAQRLECLGVLAGGIAHDLNNILAPIVMGSDLLRIYLSDRDGLSILDTIQASSQRGSDVVKQILSFARGAAGGPTAIDLKPLIKEVTKLLRETFARTIQFQTSVPSNLPMVMCNPTELHQVLMNLCVNARDAMPEGGLLQIKAAVVEINAVTLKEHPNGVAGTFVRLTVADSGTGISAEALPHVFEPFFTTKEEGKGTGLGLSTVLSIVKRNNGFIELETAEGEGTRFQIYLPAAKPEEMSAVAGKTMERRGNGEQILLVDDESGILEMARVVLENSNYRVAVASEGIQALRTVLGAPNDWSLVITDASMPIMDGPTLIRELRRLPANIPVICATGHSSNQSARVQEARADLVLRKPYTSTELLNAVASVLESRKARP